MNTIWKKFTVSGAMLMIYSLFMGTTVETSIGSVHNIGLLNRQNSFLMLGGILFIAGLILRSSDKSSKMSVDGEGSSQARLAAIKQKRSAIAGIFKDLIPRDSMGIRLASAFVVGGMFALTFGSLLRSAVIGLSFFLIAIVIAFRKSPAKVAIFPLWVMLATLFSAIWLAGLSISIVNLVQIAGPLATGKRVEFLPILFTVIIAFTVITLPFASGYFLFPRFNKRGRLSFVLKFLSCFLGAVFLLVLLIISITPLLE